MKSQIVFSYESSKTIENWRGQNTLQQIVKLSKNVFQLHTLFTYRFVTCLSVPTFFITISAQLFAVNSVQ